jgi:hypothetical protein
MQATHAETAAVERVAGPYDAEIAARRAANIARHAAEAAAQRAARVAKLAASPEVVNGWAAVSADGFGLTRFPQPVADRLVKHPHALQLLAQRRLGTLTEDRRADAIAAAQRELAHLGTCGIFDERANDGLPRAGQMYAGAHESAKARAQDILVACLGVVS